MKKKFTKSVLILVGGLVILWGTMITTDYVRCSSLKAPIFAVSKRTADDGGSGTYQGIGYSVEIEKHLDAEFGACVDAVEMRLLGTVIAASVS